MYLSAASHALKMTMRSGRGMQNGITWSAWEGHASNQAGSHVRSVDHPCCESASGIARGVPQGLLTYPEQREPEERLVHHLSPQPPVLHARDHPRLTTTHQEQQSIQPACLASPVASSVALGRLLLLTSGEQKARRDHLATPAPHMALKSASATTTMWPPRRTCRRASAAAAPRTGAGRRRSPCPETRLLHCCRW